MNVHVKLFAMAREIAGVDQIDLTLTDSATTSEVFSALSSKYPGMMPWKEHCRIAVNHEYVGADHPLQDGDEVAVIPPVSGG